MYDFSCLFLFVRALGERSGVCSFDVSLMCLFDFL